MPQRFLEFLRKGIWQIRLEDLSRKKASLIRLVRIILLTFRGFNNDRCQLNASALTYYSLLSIVPVVAMIFGIAKGFGFERRLEAQLLEKIPSQEAVLTQVISFAKALLQNTQGGIIAGIGIVVLFWTVIHLLGNIERSFNDIWKIRQARSFGRKFADYLAFMLITPVLFILSSSATVYITTQITHITEQVSLVETFSPIIFFFLKWTPYVLIWVLFSLVYMLMPNTRVRFVSGVLGGVIAGTIYQLVQWAYINFQIGIAKYNAIYGSFAALPLFLVWLQTSWMIVLFGAELAYAHQSADTYEFEPGRLRISHRYKQLIALQIAHLVVDRFSKGRHPLTIQKIAARLQFPVRITRQIVKEFVQTGMFSQINNNSPKASVFQPGLDPDQLSIHYVINSLDTSGTDQVLLPENESAETLFNALKTFDKHIQKLPENRLLKEI
jgi:membrane protein